MPSIALFLVIGLMGSMSLISPYIGLLGFVWFDYVAPHTVLYGPLSELPYSMIIGASLALGWLIKEKAKFENFNALLLILMIYAVWVTLTTISAMFPETAMWKWERTIKVLGSSILLALMLKSRLRIEGFMLTACAAMGYYAFRGAIRVITEGPSGNLVVGNGASFLSDRNTLAVGLSATLPYLYVLANHSLVFNKLPYAKFAAAIAALCSVASITGSLSRSGTLALCATLFVFIALSKQRIKGFVTIGVLATMAVLLLPTEWLFERMSSIQTYKDDDSSLQRLSSWQYGWDIFRNSPITGGGFTIYRGHKYEGIRIAYLDAHSWFFEVLAEHGGPGLILFILLQIMAIVYGLKLRKLWTDDADLKAYRIALGNACVAGTFALTLGGLFVGIASYSYVFFHISLCAAAYACEKRKVKEAMIAASHASKRTFRYGKSLHQPVGGQ
jgi:putative inorganic carbon (hco3(-)) transporter